MLFKVYMTENFADEGDRVGIIEAESLDRAIVKLCDWSSASLMDTDYEQTGDVEVIRGSDFTEVEFPMADLDGHKGRDSYRLVQEPGGMLMFLAEDWNLTFR